MSASATASPAQSCPRCGRPTGPQFSGSGLCPACAAASLLDQTQSGRASLSPFADAVGGPEHVGPYRIIETLGAGGMGTVFLAQHRQLGRIVALKVIPLHGGGGRELRFQREAQTVASLRHPHIVTVHDAGADARHFYFAMDYVEGGDLAARLRRTPYAPRDAAALVRKIAEAVAYSHAQGVLHRDLKPSNILLEGDEPRVADFGLAAPLESGGDLTQHTSVLGTPHYLAPEALLKGSAAQSPASDVYSLGVILYELLCARLPFAASTPVELQQLIATAEPLAPHLLAPRVPRDLETICLKALAADPTRRYATAAAFAEDLRRFLAGETILARPASPAGRLVRWARRRPSLAALWLLLTIVATGSTIAAWRINQERRLAQAEAAKSRALLDFLTKDLLGQQNSERAEPDPDLKLRTLVDRASANLAQRFAAQPEIAEPINQVLGSAYFAVGDYKAAREHLRRAIELARIESGPKSARTGFLLTLLATTCIPLGLPDEAQAALTESRAIALNGHGPRSHAIASIDAITGNLLIGQGKLAEAAALLEPSIALIRTLPPAENYSPWNSFIILAGVYGRQERYAECIALLEESIANYPAQPPVDLSTAKQSLAVAYLGLFKFAEAEQRLREVIAFRTKALGPEHPRTLVSQGSLVVALSGLQRFPEAIALSEQLIATRTRLLGSVHPDTLRSYESLALTYLAVARPAEAITWLERTLSGRREKLPPTHPEIASAARTLAYAHLLTGAPQRTVDLLAPTVPPARPNVAPSWQTALHHALLGVGYLRLGNAEKAEPLLREATPLLLAERARLPRFWPAFADTLPAELATAQAALTAQGPASR